MNMLEKHLGHLKKQPPGMDPILPPPPPPGVMAGKASLKSEDSPATSPATVTNWTSPGGLAGMSPAGSVDEQYLATVQGHPGGPYAAGPALQPGPSPQALTFSGSPMGAPRPQAHRRQISEISGGQGEMGPDIKRQQIYGQGPPGPMPPHLGPQPPMGQPMQAPMNPMQRRAG